MKLLEMHPDHLTDRELAGLLSDDERRVLDLHRASCKPCALEAELFASFNDELGPDAETQSVRLVLNSLVPQAPTDEVHSTHLANASHRNEQTTQLRNKQRRRTAAAGAFAVALCISGFAAAKSEQRQRAFRSAHAFVAFVANGMIGKSSQKELPQISQSQSVEPPAALSGMAQVNATAAASGTAAPQPEPMVGFALSDQTPPLQPEGRVAPIVTVHANVANVAKRAETSTAAQWFDRARSLRQAGSFEEAERAYAKLVSQYPQSNEAKTALAVSGRMQLDRGNPQLALERFGAYLRSGHGALREEAMAGRALALRRLPRQDEEHEAWRALLASYPQSSYAGMARTSLQMP